jgi:hypothetical protein
MLRKFFIFSMLLFLLAGCHEKDFVFHLVTPVATGEITLLPTVTPAPVVEVVPSEEVGEVAPNPTPVPPCDQIKGNVNSAGERIYFTVKSINYKNVKIDETKGEKWFCSEDEALAAGWRKALR